MLGSKTYKLFAAFIFAGSLIGCGGGAGNGGDTAPANRSSGNTGNVATTANANTSVVNSISNALGSGTSMTDEEFMKQAAIGGMSEIETGKLAAAKATNPEVKKFGQMMVSDHTKNSAELKSLAGKKNITLPTALDNNKQEAMTDLQKQTGAGFDRAYVEMMVEDHQETVEMFENKAEGATDPEVKAFAAKSLPTLRQHLEQIRGIQSNLK